MGLMLQGIGATFVSLPASDRNARAPPIRTYATLPENGVLPIDDELAENATFLARPVSTAVASLA